jgi:hypothetical protein
MCPFVVTCLGFHAIPLPIVIDSADASSKSALEAITYDLNKGNRGAILMASYESGAETYRANLVNGYKWSTTFTTDVGIVIM